MRLGCFTRFSWTGRVLLIILACALCVSLATVGCKKRRDPFYFLPWDETAEIVADADTWTWIWAPDTNYGSDTELCAGYFEDDEEHIYLHFDTSSIPATATVYSAEIWIYIDYTYNYTGVSFLFSLETPDAAWVENVITWNNAPTSTPVVDFTGPRNWFTGWFRIKGTEIDNLVQGWIDGGINNYGVAIKPSWLAPSDDEIYVDSFETIGGRPPQLVVKYNE